MDRRLRYRAGKHTKDKFQEQALKESLKSTYKFGLGAVVVQRGQIVGRGFNYVCYVGGRNFLNGTHAEIAAINNTRAADRLGATLYVARYRKSDTLGCAKPCPACEKVLRKLGVKNVWYTDYGDVWRKLVL